MEDSLTKNHQYWYYTLVKIANRCIHLISKTKSDDNLVVVFDIDNTLLDANNKVIEPIRAVYYYCNMLGITTALITARSGTSKNINLTKKQLNDAFICDVGFMYFRKPGDKNVLNFKEKSRLNIEKRGFKIIMSIGDQDCDITGKCCGIPVQLPVFNKLSFSYVLL